MFSYKLQKPLAICIFLLQNNAKLVELNLKQAREKRTKEEKKMNAIAKTLAGVERERERERVTILENKKAELFNTLTHTLYVHQKIKQAYSHMLY